MLDNQVKYCITCKKIPQNKKSFYCRKCEHSHFLRRYRTKKGLISKIYTSQKQSSVKRGHPLPTYARKQLKEWIINQKLFHSLFKKWEECDFDTDLIPSIDRIDDDIGYTMANIQLMTWAENREKGFTTNSDLKNPRKPIIQLTINNKIVRSFDSATDANKETGFSRSRISTCCNKNLKTKGGEKATLKGFVWVFKEINK